MLQDSQFATLTERGYFFGNFNYFLAILSLKKSPFWPFLLEKLSQIHKIGDFGCTKSSKFETNQ